MAPGIPSRLREARKKLNLNQVQIAADLDIQQKSISDIENGKIQNIPNEYIYYFYKKGVSLEWIYDAKGSMLLNKSVRSEADNPISMSEELLIDFNKPMEKHKTGLLADDVLSEKQDMHKMFERIIDAKEYNIRSLLAYIRSLENNQEYYKNLLDKSLVSKILNFK